MRQIGLLLAILTIGIAPKITFADALCVKVSQSVVSNKVEIASAIKVASGSCPSGFTRVLSTEAFRGPKGEVGEKGATGARGATGATGARGLQGPMGLAAVSHATCRKVSDQFVSEISSDSRESVDINLSCDEGEYAYLIREQTVTEYSEDWNLNEDDSYAGSTVEEVEVEAAQLSEIVFDDEDLFKIGFHRGALAVFSEDDSIQGSLTQTTTIKLTCCLIGE